MILSRRDYLQYLQADLKANGMARWRFHHRWREPVLCYQRHLRRTELIVNTCKGPLFALLRGLARRSLRNHGIKLGFTIAPNSFGPGLSIAHWGTIVVNADSRIGAECRIHPGTCLGWANGGVPMLGDRCYIGPGAKIYGPVVLGDETKVGANAVVNRSFPEGHTTLVGMPARPVRPSRATSARIAPQGSFRDRGAQMDADLLELSAG